VCWKESRELRAHQLPQLSVKQRKPQRNLNTTNKEIIMPMVKGKKFPYTKEGMAAAATAKKKKKKAKKKGGYDK
jgi:hypothetical protein